MKVNDRSAGRQCDSEGVIEVYIMLVLGTVLLCAIFVFLKIQYFVVLMRNEVLLLLLLLLLPLCMVFTITRIYLKQTMLLGYIVLQLF